MPWIEKSRNKKHLEENILVALKSVSIGVGMAAAAFLLVVVLAVYALHSG
jgi:hypothetical protein